MGILCAICDHRIEGGLNSFIHHCQRHDPPLLCCEDDCHRRKFAAKTSLYRHLRDHHMEQCASDTSSSDIDDTVSSLDPDAISEGNDDQDLEIGGGVINNDNANNNGGNNDQILENGGGSINDDNTSNNETFDFIVEDLDPDLEFNAALERSAARLILDLLKRGNVTGTAVSVVIEESQRFIHSIIASVKKEIERNLKNRNVNDDIIEECVRNVTAVEPFQYLKTKEQQLNYFEKNFGFVRKEEQPGFLGLREDNVIGENGVAIPIQVKKKFQHVSVTKMLTAILNNKILYKLIHSEKKSTDGKMRSFLDGSLAAHHPLISEFPFTLRLTLHCDDFDTPNPLGSKTCIHKITEINYQIQNLPPAENARLRSVLVLAYAYREDLPADGIGAMLEHFFLEMEQLETPDGVVINVNGRPYTLRATLVAGAADDLAAHEALGLYSPSCARFCSVCTILKKDFLNDIFARGELRTKELHQFHLRELNERSEAFMKKNYGVQFDSALQRKAKYAEFPEAMIKDGMHDILKGVGPMELKLALHEFCVVKKYFDVFYFNHRIQTFNYGPGDSKNKPTPNFTIDSVQNKGSYSIHQSAAQTWCLLQVFPFLVADKVPPDDPHLRLIVLLKCICRNIFSHVVAEKDLQELETDLFEHHTLFVTLYPQTEGVDAVPDPAAGEEGEEEEDEGEEEVDNPEDLLQVPEPAHDRYVIEENNDNEPDEEGNNAIEPEEQPRRKKKKPKKIRQINKHHHLLQHYVETMRKYGPAVLYWCMRYEGKHALVKRFASIVCNYKNLPVTFLDLQQLSQCAELLDLETDVANEIFVSKGSFIVAGETPYSEALSIHGINNEDIVEEVRQLVVAGFLYQNGLYVNLQIETDTPLFGHICNIYVHSDNVYLITKDVKGLYDRRFDAYRIEVEPDPLVRVLLVSNLPPDKPMTGWTVNGHSFYLSPRRTLAESLMQEQE